MPLLRIVDLEEPLVCAEPETAGVVLRDGIGREDADRRPVLVDEGGAIGGAVVGGVVEGAVVVVAEETAVVIGHGAAGGDPELSVAIEKGAFQSGSALHPFVIKSRPFAVGLTRPNEGVLLVVEGEKIALVVEIDTIGADVIVEVRRTGRQEGVERRISLGRLRGDVGGGVVVVDAGAHGRNDIVLRAARVAGNARGTLEEAAHGLKTRGARGRKERPVAPIVAHGHLRHAVHLIRVVAPRGDEEFAAGISHEIGAVLPWAEATVGRGGARQVDAPLHDGGAEEAASLHAHPQAVGAVGFEGIAPGVLPDDVRHPVRALVAIESGITLGDEGAAGVHMASGEGIGAHVASGVGIGGGRGGEHHPHAVVGRSIAHHEEIERTVGGEQTCGRELRVGLPLGAVVEVGIEGGDKGVAGGEGDKNVVVKHRGRAAVTQLIETFDELPFEVDSHHAACGGDAGFVTADGEVVDGEVGRGFALELRQMDHLPTLWPEEIDASVGIEEHEHLLRGRPPHLHDAASAEAVAHAVDGGHFARLRVANQQIAVEEGIEAVAVADALRGGVVGEMGSPAVGRGRLCRQREGCGGKQKQGDEVFHKVRFEEGEAPRALPWSGFGGGGGFLRGEVVAQSADGAGAVGETVFHLGAEFCKGLPEVFWLKHGVVAETARTARGGGDTAFHFAFKEMLLSLLY